MSGRQRLTFAAIAAVIAIVAIVIAVTSGGGDDATTASATPTPTATASAEATATATADSGGAEAKPAGTVVVVKGGQPAGGIKKIKVEQGEDIDFTVRSDVSDEIHVHGYDLMKDVKAGGKVSFDFPAKITGVFEVELENAGVQIAQLTVEP